MFHILGSVIEKRGSTHRATAVVEGAWGTLELLHVFAHCLGWMNFSITDRIVGQQLHGVSM